jgi:glycosyltransferase involved in cell wall biosynthesis
MPVRNHEDFLPEAIESVLVQTYGSWELVIIDDGSTDASAAIAERYARDNPSIHALAHSDGEHRGISATRNLGLSESAGEYVAFLDSDDVWNEWTLATLVGLITADDQAAVAYGSTLWWVSWDGTTALGSDFSDEVGARLGLDSASVDPPRIATRFLEDGATVPCICSFIAAREAIESVGGFENEFRGAYEDQVLYMKLALEYRAVVTNAPLSRYRRHTTSTYHLSESSGEGQSERRRYLRWVASYANSRGIHDPAFRSALERQLGTEISA